MKKSKMGAFLAIALVAIVVLLGAVACGGDKATDGEASPEATPAMTTAENWADILGHEPTGLAKEVLDRGKIVVANDANYAPFSSLDDSGVLVGFDVDVAKRTAELLGVELEQVQPSWDTIPTGLKAGRFDVSIGSMTPTDERKQTLAFTAPYYWTTQQLMIKKGATPITSTDEMKGKSIGVGGQTTAFYFLQDLGGVQIKAYASDLDAFPDLKNGRLDGVITAGPSETGVIASGEPFELSGDPLWYEAASFALVKGESDWLAMLNWAVKTMHEDGSLPEMSKASIFGFDLSQVPPEGADVVGGRE